MQIFGSECRHCSRRVFAHTEQGCLVLGGSLTPVPSGWHCTSFAWLCRLLLFYFFFNSPASFHGDDCSFDACAEVEREREIRGRYCIKLGLELPMEVTVATAKCKCCQWGSSGHRNCGFLKSSFQQAVLMEWSKAGNKPVRLRGDKPREMWCICIKWPKLTSGVFRGFLHYMGKAVIKTIMHSKTEHGFSWE